MNQNVSNRIILHNPSQEQKDVIASLGAKKNVIVDAVAGSGKTTTILHIALKYKNKNILLLTYNAKLKLETKQRRDELKIKNMEIHNYHGFCVRYFDNGCFTDYGIIEMLRSDNRNYFFNYDLVIIDEAQDITPLYYEIVCKIIYNHKIIPLICILGDKYQSIYGFNKADCRFITLGEKVFNFGSNYEWANYTLSTSYRITDKMAEFINKCIIKKNRLLAAKKGKDVRYIICDIFPPKYTYTKHNTSRKLKYNHSKEYIPFNEVIDYLKVYDHDDIFILAPSIKTSSSPARLLANMLSDVGIPIYVPSDENSSLDYDIIKNKVVFSTYHQVKGLERDVVIIFGFSDSYFKYFSKNADPKVCPNEIYVAITRARERLTIFHHYKNGYFKFLNRKNLKKHTTFIQHKRLRVMDFKSKKSKDYGVTELLKFLPVGVIDKAMSFIDICVIQKEFDKIDIISKVKEDKLYENVSEITGTAIPSYHEYIHKRTMSIYNTLYEANKKLKTNKITLPDLSNLSVEDLLKLSNQYCAYVSGYKYKLNQVTNYKWLTQIDLDLCTDRLNSHISNNAKHEVILKFSNDILKENNKVLSGSIDCIDGYNVWEFKCTKTLNNIHYIQLGIYAFLVKYTLLYEGVDIDDIKKTRYFLFNILTNELCQIESDFSRLSDMVEYLLNYKFGNRDDNTSNGEFLDLINNIQSGYIQ